MPTISPDDIARFADDGVLPLRAAIPADQVALMREVIWQRLHEIGVRQDDRATWKTVNNRPLRRIKRHPLFAAIDAPRLHGAIDDLAGAGRWSVPDSWGMFRITAPAPGPPWEPTPHGWHSDCRPWNQQPALFAFIHIGETVPGGGGTLMLAGSHRRLAAIAAREGPDRRTSRHLVAAFHDGSAWLQQLMGLAPCERPRATFMTEPSPPDEHGVRMRVIEAAGQPGDAWLCHASIYHAGSDNRSQSMRMMRLCMLQHAPGHCRDDPASDTPLARCVRPRVPVSSRTEPTLSA